MQQPNTVRSVQRQDQNGPSSKRDSSFFFLLGKTKWICCLRLQQGISASGSQDKWLKWLPLVLVPSHLLEVLAAFVSLCTMSRQVQRPCCVAKNLAHCCPQKSRTVSAPPKYATTQNKAAHCSNLCSYILNIVKRLK